MKQHETSEMVPEGARLVGRRDFLKFGTAAAFALAMPPVAAGLSGCRSEAGDAVFRGERTITDHADRTLTIPTASSIKKIYYTSPLAQVYVVALCPEKQGGTGTQFTTKQLEYLPDDEDKLIYMGSISQGGEIDLEMLMKQDIDIIFSISGVGLTATNISDAEKLQDQTGIPVVLVDGSFDKIVEAFRFVGDILGTEARASEISEFLDKIYKDVTAAVADIKDEERISLYYAEGPFGLSTAPDISQHALTFEVAKARNVAAAVPISGSGYGMSGVSLESVIKWDPEVIVAWDSEIQGGADELIRASNDWSDITAVKTGRVYTMPASPFAWCDRPPGVNRFIGLQWVANMLYPDKYDVDMKEETKKFYKMLYNVEITDAQALELLGNSYPPYGKK